MGKLRNIVDKVKPTFSEGGKLSMFRSVFEGFETFLLVPNETSKPKGVHIHDAIDSKRIMIMVVIALMPALLFGMYNVGYQHYLAIGQAAVAGFWSKFWFGFLAVLPKILVTYIVGLGIEFTVAQWKGEDIQEGYLASGLLIPMIIPVNCPLWCLALACAFAVILCKEIFGGTGMNFINPALGARAFLFFSYPTVMSGDMCWVAKDSIFGLGYDIADATTAATPLGIVSGGGLLPDSALMDGIIGLIPGSMGETSVIAIAIGAILLIWTGVASWKIMLSVFVGGGLTAALFNQLGMSDMCACQQLVLGGFAFGAVFMATDPVTACRTENGKYIYGFIIGALAIIIRQFNPGYPEGMMMAILMGNLVAPLIDYCFVQSNINKRLNRAK